MSTQFRLPNITAQDLAGQMQQMKSYLYQMVEQLNWALENVNTGSMSADIEESSSGKTGSKDPVQTFSDIKSLIIKSADIVNAYYEKMNQQFSGEYVAQSTFGKYTEQTDQDIAYNSTQIQQAFTNLQNLTTTVSGLESLLISVNAYINSGLLYYDDQGVPVYGIEVGQRTEVDGVETFNKYARFTANKLSFYDENANEVAYISDYKLHITNVEITGSFRHGHLVSEVQSDSSVVRRYEGG